MVHTITSAGIPEGALTFDYIWQAPSDTFFQYIPEVAGLYEYVCTPHVAFNMVGSITVEDGTTQINDGITSKEKVMIYPNPADHSLHIESELQGFPYFIYNLSGEVVLKGVSVSEIDVSSLGKGIYFVKISGANPFTQKIIKK